MSRILGLGGVTTDQIGVVDHLPGPDEVIRLQDFRVEQGGMVATALVAAARLGADTAFLGALGDDANGQRSLASFAAEGVDTSWVQTVAGAVSAFSFILVEKHTGLRTIIHEPGIQRNPVLENLPDKPEELLSGVGFLHLDGFWMDSAVRLAEAAKSEGIVITLDVGQNQRDPRIEVLLRLADYVIPSLTFARRFSGHDRVEEAAESLLSFGAKAVIQTLGEQGVLALTEDGQKLGVPAFTVQVVDTTGAGDSFHGGFLFALSKGYALKQALVFASAVAALKCTRLGGQAGLPSFRQVQDFLP
jgi:ribokinase